MKKKKGSWMSNRKKEMISMQWIASGMHIISLGTRSPSRWYQCFKRVHVSCRHRNRVGSLLIHTLTVTQVLRPIMKKTRWIDNKRGVRTIHPSRAALGRRLCACAALEPGCTPPRRHAALTWILAACPSNSPPFVAEFENATEPEVARFRANPSLQARDRAMSF